MSVGVERFEVPFREEDMEEVRQKLAQARPAPASPSPDWKAGTPTHVLQDAIKYWKESYDWKAAVEKLNTFDHFTCPVDDLRIHFIHQKTTAKERTPLLLIHGWPGSVFEFHKLIPLLTADKDGHGFDVIAPSLPGYGWSEAPKQEGMDTYAIANVFDKLMKKLGYEHYVVQGGDWGGIIARALGRHHAKSCVGLHVNFLACVPPPVRGPVSLWHNVRHWAPLVLAPLVMSKEDSAMVATTRTFFREGTGYQFIQATRPDTLAQGLNDSPVGLLSWLLEKFYAWSDSSAAEPFRSVSLDEVLTHVMIYWTTQSIGSSMHLYYESLAVMRSKPLALSGGYIDVPTAAACFPKEIIQTPESVARRTYNLQQYTKFEAGGHFAALEQPEVLASDVRRFFGGRSTFSKLQQRASALGNASPRTLAPPDWVDMMCLVLVVALVLWFVLSWV
ncbi:hypothetical protein PTSG_00421 [Salpingoeca rosetta]|uniref:Epoxide hydrolase N-terminal domain-containing protein n=1 Tax=Salpingoeca rosetta (strain ATCC 50818 / BSB-021) TaxID=946362 RepID=F2TWF5_SALR5|nr:uncharacterized protein PTSG_00421 [Salpingoeca rosetta]EGD72401.1 hypothetical protein PTSG_00421 [Salpingoeca rosetta]|eukprot:XP_004998970.1 hypothetical protein PTSG_00421 [Salpingoeca rosetta]